MPKNRCLNTKHSSAVDAAEAERKDPGTNAGDNILINMNMQSGICPDHSSARWIFPLVVLGSSSRNTTMRGYLYGAVRCFT